MENRLESALRHIGTGDQELTWLRQSAHQLQQDIAGLTREQSDTLYSIDQLIVGGSLVTDFDREQISTLYPEAPFLLK